MTYYRITGWGGPVRTEGRDWDVCIRRVAGWYYTIDTAAGAGCRVRIVIDRNTRRHYRVADNLGRVVSPIGKAAARDAYIAAGRPRLVPVLD
ncbi:MAG: hypothetical protein EBR82_70945 [Caulobacteraceae bacterium]|nr:hypothetical protein [Caulobacteraceae bacterium]